MFGSSGEVITTVARRVLSARGPMSEDDLLGVLEADGFDFGSDPGGVLANVVDQEIEPFVPLTDERRARIPDLLGGVGCTPARPPLT